MPSAERVKPPGRARKRAVAAATLLVVAAAIVVAAIVATGRGHHQTGRLRRVAAGTATVKRRNLVTSEVETGTISYAGSATVVNRLAGTVTWAPPVGRVIEPGHRLFDVDNFPVILMDGTVPVYRTLESSDPPGPDILQLNRDLVALGFDPDGIVVDDEWQPATTAGVDAFQEANDEQQTGRLTVGTIVFLHGAQRVAGLEGGATAVADDAAPEQGSEFVDDTVMAPAGTSARSTTATSTSTETRTTSTPSPRPAAPTTPNAPTKPAAPTTTTATTTETVTTPAPPAPSNRPSPADPKLGTELRRLQQQNRQLQRKLTKARSHNQSQSADSEPPPGGGSAVLTTTSTNLVVTVNVPAGEQSVTHVGARVPVVMPSGATVHGHVTKIGQASASGGSSTVPITIHLDKRENGRNLDQATVSVKLVSRTARRVLSVPVTALVARPGGGYAVQEARAPYRLIDVKLGTFATGEVQISGRGLHPGMKVTDSQG